MILDKPAIQDRDARCALRRRWNLCDVLQVEPKKAHVERPSGRKVNRTNVAMTEKLFGENARCVNAIEYQSTLPNSVEPFDADLAHPGLERPPHALTLWC